MAKRQNKLTGPTYHLEGEDSPNYLLMKWTNQVATFNNYYASLGGGCNHPHNTKIHLKRHKYTKKKDMPRLLWKRNNITLSNSNRKAICFSYLSLYAAGTQFTQTFYGFSMDICKHCKSQLTYKMKIKFEH